MIGIFDSGIGGLTFARELHKQLPDYDFIYLGDQLRVPYGGRSEEAVQQFTEECVQKLWDMGAKLIIIACNTASAKALRYLQQKYTDKKILGVIIPAVEASLEGDGNIGVVATRSTVASETYVKEIAKRNPEKRVYQVAAPLLVPFIEEGMGKSPECIRLIRKYLRPLKNAHVQQLILACTHYPLIEDVFQRVMGPQIEVINSAKISAEKLVDYLQRHPEIDAQLSRKGSRAFFTTDCPDYFSRQAKIFYGKSFTQAEKIYI